jgi:L-fucose isomerase-like protein
VNYAVKVGFAPTRRGAAFVNQDALKYKKMIAEKLGKWNVDFVDIEDINEEGLLRGPYDVDATIEKFKKAHVDCLFFPHCNFGSEHSVSKVAHELKLPVLLWGPRDEAPLEDGSRLRDTQCGLFATGKVLRRVRTPFTYLPNCRVDDDLFDKGFHAFLAAANVIRNMRTARILQISTRPTDFWTMMVNEGELLERFNVQVFPIAMSDFTDRVKQLETDEKDARVEETVKYIYGSMDVCVSDEIVRRVAAMKETMKRYSEENGCSAVAIQCWDALQNALQIMPCCANSLLTDEGLPVVCETDIHGAISAIMAQSAGMGKTPSFFVDWSIRHPDNDNGELLQHCGPWPLSLAIEKPKLARPFAFEDNCPGNVIAEIKGGEISIIRFDGDNGEYGILMGTAKGIKGPHNKGTFLWVEIPEWTRVETMIVKGPYLHHAVAIHGNILPVIYEALTYLPDVRADFYNEAQKRETENFWFGL